MTRAETRRREEKKVRGLEDGGQKTEDGGRETTEKRIRR